MSARKLLLQVQVHWQAGHTRCQVYHLKGNRFLHKSSKLPSCTSTVLSDMLPASARPSIQIISMVCLSVLLFVCHPQSLFSIFSFLQAVCGKTSPIPIRFFFFKAIGSYSLGLLHWICKEGKRLKFGGEQQNPIRLSYDLKLWRRSLLIVMLWLWLIIVHVADLMPSLANLPCGQGL